jgi:transcriptional regulator of met regulon
MSIFYHIISLFIICHKVIVHSALDRFDELTKLENMKDRPTVGLNSMYIGLLGCYDELKVYGKFSLIKLICMIYVYNIRICIPYTLQVSICFCEIQKSQDSIYLCKIFIYVFIGYNTSTKTKFMATVEDSIVDENQHFVREAGLKALFVSSQYYELKENEFFIFIIQSLV